MVIAQLSHFWESAVTTYSSTAATEEDKARALDRIAEALRTPLRVEHLDDLLAALAGVTGRSTWYAAG